MQRYEFNEESEKRQPRAKDGKIPRLMKRYAGLINAVKFATGSAIGFLDTEIILVVGSYFLYGKLSAPQSASSSASLWALNAAAFGIGVTVAFFVNEMLILRNEGGTWHKFGLWSILGRLVKFQLIFLTGNLIIVIVQLMLLREFSVPPYLGNIIGAIVSFPTSYFFSMRFVWSLNNTTKYSKSRGASRAPQEEWEKTIADVHRALRNFPGFRDENHKIKVNEYRLDLSPLRENLTLMDFGLSLEVITQGPEKKLES
jgi:putative flippase GtrA